MRSEAAADRGGAQESSREIDVKAFLIVSDARDVYGEGFGNITVIE